jgi:hypothetical protein
MNLFSITDDYARKLFRKECFADQDHFLAQDSYEIIPSGFISGYFRERILWHLDLKITLLL